MLIALDVDSLCRPENEDDLKARCHFHSAKVDNSIYCLDDDVYIKVHPASHSELCHLLIQNAHLSQIFSACTRC
jgi:hypothetical protein